MPTSAPALSAGVSVRGRRLVPAGSCARHARAGVAGECPPVATGDRGPDSPGGLLLSVLPAPPVCEPYGYVCDLVPGLGYGRQVPVARVGFGGQV